MMIPKGRPIEDVADELSKRLVRVLPGSQAVQASWSVLNQASELMHMAKTWLDKHEAEQNEVKKRTYESYMWIKHGEYYAACRMIHALADAFHVESVTWVEVPDVQVAPGETECPTPPA